jgi:hypothetical protein
VKKDNLIHSIVPLLIAVFVFGIAIGVLNWNLFIAAILAVCLYLGLSFLFSPVFKLGGVHVDLIQNSEEILALLEEGERDLSSVKTIIDTSKDPRIQEKARSVYREGRKIIEFIKKNPQKAMLARRFFNYYLDKANAILTKYNNLASVEIETERLTALKEKTLKALESFSKGMVSQFSKLISSEVMDIEAEINLLESTIKTEDCP